MLKTLATTILLAACLGLTWAPALQGRVRFHSKDESKAVAEFTHRIAVVQVPCEVGAHCISRGRIPRPQMTRKASASRGSVSNPDLLRATNLLLMSSVPVPPEPWMIPSSEVPPTASAMQQAAIESLARSNPAEFRPAPGLTIQVYPRFSSGPGVGVSGTF